MAKTGWKIAVDFQVIGCLLYVLIANSLIWMVTIMTLNSEIQDLMADISARWARSEFYEEDHSKNIQCFYDYHCCRNAHLFVLS